MGDAIVFPKDISKTKDLILPQLGSIVGGSLRTQGETFDCENPANGEVICSLPSASDQVVDEAVACAREAYGGVWRAMSPGKRQRLLTKLSALIEENKDNLSLLESSENGVPLSVVRSFSVAALAKNIGYYASWIDKLHGSVVPLSSSGALDYVVNEPYGVVALVTAYNTPSLFLGSKAGPALAAGNCVVIKPSPMASLPALRFAELASQAGIPDGVVNVVLGGAKVSSTLVSHKGIDLVSFTGSGEAGRHVSHLAAENLTPIALELGGKSPDIVFGDATLSKVTMGACIGAFALSGQACVAGSRLYVESSVVDGVTESLVKFANSLPIGEPSDPSVVLGPLISAAHRERVEQMIANAQDQGAKVLCGGDRIGGLLSNGYYLRPAVVNEVSSKCDIYRQEVFGPVLTISAFDNEEQAIELANNTPYGLGAGIWTNDLSRAHRVASRLHAGTVWVNSYGVVPHTAPFGGFKQSGNAREGGIWGLMTYLQHKNVYIDLG